MVFCCTLLNQSRNLIFHIISIWSCWFVYSRISRFQNNEYMKLLIAVLNIKCYGVNFGFLYHLKYKQFFKCRLSTYCIKLISLPINIYSSYSTYTWWIEGIISFSEKVQFESLTINFRSLIWETKQKNPHQSIQSYLDHQFLWFYFWLKCL